MPKLLIGEEVTNSPVGPGQITGFTERGLIEVNDVAVAWAVFPDGAAYDPLDCYEKEWHRDDTRRTVEG